MATRILLAVLLFTPVPLVAQEPEPEPGPVRLSGLFYLTYEQGEAAGEEYSEFAVNRSYLAGRVNVLPRLTARITLDGRQDDTGDMKVRLKYAYASYDFGDVGPLTDLNLEAGIAHMVWLGFEESINLYRMREQMFMERSGLFNSADFGLTVAGLLGAELDPSFQRDVSDAAPGRWGSFAVGVYNGGGYHAIEANENKTVEGRLTVRPLPDALPGLQLSGLAIVGKGNRPADLVDAPDWRTYNLFLSYQHEHATLTAQYVDGEGNQKGTFFDPTDPADATPYSGYAFFGEGKLGGWRIIAGYDDFDRTPGPSDRSFKRYHAGIGYDFGYRNILLFDIDRREWDADLPDDTRAQVVMQVRF
ncbi:MAG: hypothetical protein ACOC3J_00225 [Gemmatimonadota bacterium]